MDFLAKLAEGFINLFNLGGQTFMGFVTGIIPTLIVLITFVNALVSMIGEEKVNKFAAPCSKFFLLRYTVLPVLSMFILCNPMAYTFGRLLMKNTSLPSTTRLCLSATHHRPLPACESRRILRLWRHRGRHHHAGIQPGAPCNPLFYSGRHRHTDQGHCDRTSHRDVHEEEGN
jgi:hypothetical protein